MKIVNRKEMLPLLVKACPSFSDKWKEHKQEYNDEKDYLPYVALGECARHLIDLENLNQTEEFEAVFEVVERLHIEGDSFVKEAVTIGFLESLQNNLENNEVSFIKYLKPESLKWWNELNKFGNGEIKFVGQSIESNSE